MKRFSIIIPVYNTYDYLDKCLSSLVNQKNVKNGFEIIIVNDGSTDRSEDIIYEYKNKYSDIVKYISQKNQGQSFARNRGVDNSSGEYIIFVDSDDYLELDFLSKLEKHICEFNMPDLIRFNSRDVKSNGEIIKEVVLPKTKNQIDLIKKIMKKNALEVPWAYAYKASFYKKNNFRFLPYIHEDYGLIPIIIYKADTFTYMNFIGYNYVERNGSIMAETNYDKMKRRVNDFYIQYCNHMRVIKKDSKKGKLLRSYCLEAMISKLKILNDEDLKAQIKSLKSEIDLADIYCYNIYKFFKKVMLSISVEMYIKLYSLYKPI